MQDGANTLSVTIWAEPEAVPLARRALREFALGAGADPHQIDAIRLAGSEAVTNAVVHAYRDEPGNVYVTATVVSGELWVLIADDGCGMMAPRARRPGLGLGLGLISQLSDELAIVARAGGGTEVRMRFNIGVPGRSRQREVRKASSQRPGAGSCDARRSRFFRQSPAKASGVRVPLRRDGANPEA
jgi:stage II sporulation protein AB (anti-sigma F factor)